MFHIKTSVHTHIDAHTYKATFNLTESLQKQPHIEVEFKKKFHQTRQQLKITRSVHGILNLLSTNRVRLPLLRFELSSAHSDYSITIIIITIQNNA